MWPGAGPRETTGMVQDAQAHLAACAACRRFVDDMVWVADRIHSTVSVAEAPLDVRNRLFEAVATARVAPIRSVRIHQRLLMGLAATAVMVLGGWLGWEFLKEKQDVAAIAAFVDDHIATTVRESLRTGDSSVVAQWLDDRVGMELRFPVFPGAELKGARVSLISGQRGAVIEYALNGRSLSYFMVPWPQQGLSRELQFATRAGYRVVAWHDAGITHALVGGFPESELAELARYCMHVMMTALGEAGLRVAQAVPSQEGRVIVTKRL
jgi:hypothetical protein